VVDTHGIEYSRLSTPRVYKNIISGFGNGIKELYGINNTHPALILNNVIVESGQAISIDNPFSRIVNNTIVQQAGTGI